MIPTDAAKTWAKPIHNLFLSDYDLKRFCEKFNCFHELTQEDQMHIIYQLKDIVSSYNMGKNYGGGFLTEIMLENFFSATRKADSANKKCITLYEDFMKYKLPADHKATFQEFI